MSILKEAIKGLTWMGVGIALLASVEALYFPDHQTHFLTVAAMGMLDAVIAGSFALSVN